MDMIVKKKIAKQYLVVLCTALSFLTACTKDEYQAPEIGEAIPYMGVVEPDATLGEVLQNSPYTLFSQIWQRSSVSAGIEEAADRFTVLAPDNAALEQAGWTVAKIAGSPVADLDTLLLQQVLEGVITEQSLREKEDAYQAITLLEKPGLLYRSNSGVVSNPVFVAYHFQVTLAIRDGKLLLNGKSIGYQTPLMANNGIIWPVDAIWQRPTQTAWELIKSDPRFSLYAGIMEYTDNLYHQLFYEANGYYPWQAGRNQELRERVGYGLWTWTRPLTDPNTPCVDALSTFFIPTNEAFHNVGFQSLEDLIAFNESRGLPETQWLVTAGTGESPFYTLKSDFATDSLLDYHHNWGLRYTGYINATTGFTGLPNVGIRSPYQRSGQAFTIYGYGGGIYYTANIPLIYSNDLRQQTLDSKVIFLLPAKTTGNPVIWGQRNEVYYYPPFDIAEEGNALRAQGSDAPPAVIVEKDIPVLNGVVHAVDHLLVPAGFKLN